VNYPSIRPDYPEQLPSKETLYCWHCHTPGVHQHGKHRITYNCDTCGQSSGRVLAYNPRLQQHFDEDGTLIHERCGVFITRRDGRILVFKSIKYPYLLTIPTAHSMIGELPSDCAARAIKEVLGIQAPKLRQVFHGTIEDSCQQGADMHHWHVYTCTINDAVMVSRTGDDEFWGWHKPRDLIYDTTEPSILYLLNLYPVRSKVDSDWTDA
jgi:ADP-ribose pyrophosphatase YjhB (NUDIX family)